MRFSTAATLTATAAVSSSVVNAFSAEGNNNVALYWGQNSGRNQESLGSYCESTDADMYIISFLTDFPQTSLNIVGCDETFPGSTLLHCPALAADIKKCQSLGKKVLLSLGGAIGNYGFTSDSEAEAYADTLWDTFGNGESDTRPFDDAVVDGFDLDIENGNNVGYAALTKQLRKNYNGGDYYIAGAPQCVYPDASLGDALDNGYFDFVFVQFYNNPCGIEKSGFNWGTWKDYAAGSANPNVKIYLGLPGSPSAAGSGYATPDAVQNVVSSIKDDSCFGGIMMWDASQAFSNMVDGTTYCAAMKNILGGSSSDSSSASSSNAAPESSSKSSTLAFSTFVTVSSSAPTFVFLEDTHQDVAAAVESTPATSEAPVSSSVVTTAAPTSSSDSTTTVTSVDEVTSVIGTITSTSSIPQSTPLTSTTTVYATATATATATANQAPVASATAGTGTGSVIKADDVNGDCSGLRSEALSSCLNNQFNQNKAIELKPSSSQAEESSAPKSDSTFNLDSCTEGAVSCYEGKFALCNFNKWVFFDCPATTLCSAATVDDQSVVIGCNFESIVLAEQSAAQNSKRSVQIGAGNRNGLHHVHHAHRN